MTGWERTGKAAYWDPTLNKEIVVDLASETDLWTLIHLVSTIRSERGCPALEVRKSDGSSASLATDGKRALITWTNSLQETFHSVGDQGGDVMVFDYFGSWSEAPSSWLVTLEEAQLSLLAYATNGLPDTENVVFQPD